MKNVFTFLILLLAISASAQTIRRVNNNPGITGTNIFTTIQAAHDAAVNGDIIYVEPSGTSYGNLDCTKQLTILGAGYFTQENQIYQSFPGFSVLGQITFLPGSENSRMAGGVQTGNVRIFRTSNITIDRCLVNSVEIRGDANGVQGNMSGITITRNWIIQSVGCIAGTAFPAAGGVIRYTITNVNITNNLLRYVGQNHTSGVPETYQYTNFVVSNNVILEATNAINAIVQNNIIGGVRGNSIEGAIFNSVITHNSAVSAGGMPSGNNNVTGINFGDFFVNSTGTSDSGWQLKTGSSAIGSGTNGVDRGMFGGPTPYVLSGIPPYPAINSIITTGTGSNTTPLSVTISTKSNN